MLSGAVCFTVIYAQGHKTNQAFVKLVCPVTQIGFFQTINGHGCFDSLPPCSYTLSATDVDVVDNIDAMTAVSVEGIIIQQFASTSTQFLSEAESVMSATYKIATPIGMIIMIIFISN